VSKEYITSAIGIVVLGICSLIQLYFYKTNKTIITGRATLSVGMLIMMFFSTANAIQALGRLHIERAEAIEQIKDMSIGSMEAMAKTVDSKTPFTADHSARVAAYSVALAKKLGWNRAQIEDIRYAALLHDIGKIGVPDSILNNPRRLTDVEYEIIKSHTTMGGDILKGRTMIKSAEDVARSHHEKYDGTGYPSGLKGNDISEEARIVAIADAFDAMSSNRVYRRSCDNEHIRNELEKGKGRQFDPEYTDVFVKLWDAGQLDSIMQTDRIKDEAVVRKSSMLLQYAVDSFMEKRNSDVRESEDDLDIERLAERLKGDGSHKGALSVGYSEFSRMYEYASSLEERFAYPFDLVLITLSPPESAPEIGGDLERSMFFMEQAIRQTIRDVDILTRYGEKSFLVILLGADQDGAKVATDRVFRGYYKMSGSGTYLPSYRNVLIK
jgi:putative nucleotidyltransferase with HDIG domain